MAMTQASSPVELGTGAAVRTHVPAAARTAILSRAPVIVSHPGSAMTRPNGIVAGTPRERFDLDVARGNLACSAFALTAQRGDTNLAGDKAGP